MNLNKLIAERNVKDLTTFLQKSEILNLKNKQKQEIIKTVIHKEDEKLLISFLRHLSEEETLPLIFPACNFIFSNSFILSQFVNVLSEKNRELIKILVKEYVLNNKSLDSFLMFLRTFSLTSEERIELYSHADNHVLYSIYVNLKDNSSKEMLQELANVINYSNLKIRF